MAISIPRKTALSNQQSAISYNKTFETRRKGGSGGEKAIAKIAGHCQRIQIEKPKSFTTKDTEKHGGEKAIAKIAGIAKESKLKNQNHLPRRTQRNTEEIRRGEWGPRREGQELKEQLNGDKWWNSGRCI